MTISVKSRKLLWGRSGNQCAYCDCDLIMEGTSGAYVSVVGDECHIVAIAGEGPRADPSFPLENIDDYSNLILLCKTHHKMVDDRYSEFTVDVLKKLKKRHEEKVSKLLTGNFGRSAQKGPPSGHLKRIVNGKEILDIMIGAYAYEFDNDEMRSEDEAGYVGSFLQTIQDWGEIGEDISAADRVSASFQLTGEIKELDDNGFWVFGARVIRNINAGGVVDKWPIAVVRVHRKNNPNILKV
jgi:hypothetical protein